MRSGKPTNLCSAYLERGSIGGRMVYLLVMVVLGGGNGPINQPLRIGSFHTLESCEAGANEAKAIGLDRGTFGFVCVRANDLPPARPGR